MAVLALVYIGLGLVEEKAAGMASAAIQAALLAITLIFVAEFSLRLYASSSRWHYLKYHWIDLLAVLPSARFLRILGLARLTIALRVFRIARVAVIVRSLADANRATRQLKWISERNGIPTLLFLAVGVLWIGSLSAYEFEHGVNAQFGTFGDAFWWAFSTMATLGYGSGPATIPGRVVAGLLMVVGIACFGLVTATVTTFIIKRTDETPETTMNDLMLAVKELQAEVSSLKRELVEGREATWSTSQGPNSGR